MSTVLQQKLAENIVENLTREEPLNKKELLVSAGYAEATAASIAGDVIQSVGVQRELKELGFSTEGAKAVIEEIMYDKRIKPETRVSAAREMLKVTGGYAPEKKETKTLNVNVDVEGKQPIDLLQLAQKAAEQLKQQKTE